MDFVADLDPVFANCRVAFSPVRFGTGIKTKNLSALSHGVPLVTTTVGADGMNLHHDETALIADTPQEFADAAVRAYTDENLWHTLAQQGRTHITEYFSEDTDARGGSLPGAASTHCGAESVRSGFRVAVSSGRKAVS